jgi:uncharacterized protein
MSGQHGLSEKTVNAIRGVFARHAAVEQAILFGSRAKGTYKPGSDIDLVLRGSSLNQRTLNRIYEELDDLPIPYGLSLVLSSKVTDPEVEAHIRRVGIVFYERDAASINATESRLH